MEEDSFGSSATCVRFRYMRMSRKQHAKVIARPDVDS